MHSGTGMRSMVVSMLQLGVVVTFLPLLSVAQTFPSFIAKPVKGVSTSSNKKIAAVISTLKDILQSVVTEEKAETAMYVKYTAWCKDEDKAVGTDLANAKKDLANAKVLQEELIASIDALTLFVKKAEKEIADTKDSIAQAVAVRKDENNQYTEEFQTNKQSLHQIALAIKHVSKVNKQGGFLQNGVVQKLTINAPGESSYVLGIMKGLNAKLSKTRDELVKTEQDKVKMHNAFMKTTGATMKALIDTTIKKKILLAETIAKEAANKRKIGKLQDDIVDYAKEGIEKKAACQASDAEWTLRQADRKKEKAALDQAVKYLAQTSFEQESLVQSSAEETSSEDPDAVAFAPSFLQDESDSNNLLAAAGRVLMDEGDDQSFEAHMQKKGSDGIQVVVQKLIASHSDTQKEETTKKKYCNYELASKDDEKSTLMADLAEVRADIAKKSAEVVTIADEVKSITKSMEQLKKSVAEALKTRKAEKALFDSSSKDGKLAIKVLEQAARVLDDFYKKKSLLQESDDVDSAGEPRKKKPKTWSKGSARKGVASTGAVLMVENIIADVQKELKDAAINEGKKVSAYDALKEESSTKMDSKQQDLTDRSVAKAKLGVNVNTLKETETMQKEDLVRVNQQLTALHKSCDELLKFYEQRLKARAFEVDQLRDVKDILNGASIASRTGLLQQPEDAAAAAPIGEVNAKDEKEATADDLQIPAQDESESEGSPEEASDA